MAHVSLEKVSKLYPGNPVPAVNAIDLDIKDREFIVLVGPSGCGKSTTLRMVAGLEEISGGEIKIGERVVNNVPPKDRDIAMVFQNYALYPHMSVYKNMAFGLMLRRRELGLSKQEIDSRVREAARILGITPYLERKPKALSGGQRQRVAVGRAIVRNPKAFLFDEPLSNLDAKLRVETRAEIKKLHLRLKTTTIYVTHDQEEAMTLGDRIVVMKDGFIHQCAPPLEVYERPVNRFVASFVGTPPMNFLKGRLVDGTTFGFANQKVRFTPEIASRLSRYAGKEMTLGIRPESLCPAPIGKYAGVDNGIKGKVVVAEPLGDKVDIYVSLSEGQETTMDRLMVCRADAYEFGKVKAEDIITLYVDLSRVHVFEPGEAGVNVTLTKEASHAAA
jgi:multiple sugar transport system ATP-binding protein